MEVCASSFNSESTENGTELESHADTCVVGKHGHIVAQFDRTVNVTGYDHKLDTMKNVHIFTAALAYDDHTSGEVIILNVHQSVHIPSMENDLLCPMQMRLADVVVNDCPKFVHENPTNATHSIIVKATEDDNALVIPLSLQGVTLYFLTRCPTDQELTSCRSFDLTSDAPDSNPINPMFQEQEVLIVDNFGLVKETGDRS